MTRLLQDCNIHAKTYATSTFSALRPEGFPKETSTEKNVPNHVTGSLVCRSLWKRARCDTLAFLKRLQMRSAGQPLASNAISFSSSLRCLPLCLAFLLPQVTQQQPAQISYQTAAGLMLSTLFQLCSWNGVCGLGTLR